MTALQSTVPAERAMSGGHAAPSEAEVLRSYRRQLMAELSEVDQRLRELGQ